MNKDIKRKFILVLLFLSFVLSLSALSGYWWTPVSCPDINDLASWLSLLAIFLALIAFIYFLVKRSKWAIVAVLAGILGLVALLTFAPCPHRTRDARIFSAISQSRTIMSLLYEQDGHYDNFNCQQKELLPLCEGIDINYGLKDDKEPIITKDTISNSQKACIYSPVEEKNGHWVCADSSEGWRVGLTNINPANEGYCVDGESAVCPPFIESQVVTQEEVENEKEQEGLAEEERGPKDVVLDFYNCYLNSLGDFAGKLDNCHGLEHGYKQALIESEPIIANPILCASDWPDTAYPEIESEQGNDMIVSFPPVWAWHKVRVSVALVDGEWLITNIAPVQDEIIDWQTYHNEEGDYKFQYPNEWAEGDVYPFGNDADLVYEVDEICDEPDSDDPDWYWAGLSCKRPAKIYIALFPKSIFIDAEDESSIPSAFDEYGKLVVQHDERFPGLIFTEVNNFNLLDHRAIRFSSHKEGASYKKETVMIEVSPKEVLDIDLSYLPRYEEYVLSVFDTLISTLEFTK